MAAQPEPEVRCYAGEVRRCRRCGGKVRGATAGYRSGPARRDSASCGSACKSAGAYSALRPWSAGTEDPVIVEDLTGVRLTQGAITQDAIRQSEGGVGAQYERLRAAVPDQAVVHTDDTGWRVAR